MGAAFIDDKTPLCVPFILDTLKNHAASGESSRPFFVGINGVQGAGKTTLVRNLEKELDKRGHKTLVCSIDDFYKTHEDLLKLAQEKSDNALYQHRGVPGTHDVALLQSFLDDILQGRPTKVPVYDKSLHQGRGDRAPISQWLSIPNPRNYKIIIVEGWCVGFESIPEHRLVAAYGGSSRTLSQHTLEHLRVMNDYLVDYSKILKFDAFVHIDAEDLSWVYEWRQEQEDAMRRDKGDETVGMSKEEVVKFVDGYYPAYELYTEDLRKGMFRNATQDSEGRHLRLIVGRDRKVKEAKRL